MGARRERPANADQPVPAESRPECQPAAAPVEDGAPSAKLPFPNLMSAWHASSAKAGAESSFEVSTVKQVAAAALILGQNVSKTASALGVDRRTIQRWRKLDPEFQLAMIETKQEVIVSSRQNILALAESAVRVVEKELSEEQNARAALALLRGVGVLSYATLDGQQYEAVLEMRERFEEAAAEQESQSEQDSHEFGAESATLAESDEFAGPPPEEETVYELSDLPPTQQTAVNAFYSGKTLAEVALLAQTSEATLRGWLCQDRPFFSVLSDLQFERIHNLKHRIYALIEKAMQIIRREVVAGNPRIAMAILRGLGMFS